LLTRGQIHTPAVRMKSSFSLFRDFSTVSVEVKTFYLQKKKNQQREKDKEACFSLKENVDNLYL